MLFQFPYTNLYNLNLDWMIKAMKEMQEIVEPLDRVVNSVNNMTGDVVLTKAFLLNILESMVSKFNGRAGDVTLTAADVNSTMIDITWTSDPGDVIEDIAQNVRDQLYAIGKRVLIFVNNQGVPDQIYFLTLVGDVVTPQIYSPTAALAGVASFNGQTGAVTATGSDLDTSSDDDTPISESIGDLQTAVGEQSQQIDSLQAAAAYVEDGDNATQKTYSEGEFIVWKGTLYTVNSGGIPLGTAITGHVTAVTGGGLNVLNNKLIKHNITVTTTAIVSSSEITAKRYGGICIVSIRNLILSSAITTDTVIANLNVTPSEVAEFGMGESLSGVSVLFYVSAGAIYISGITGAPAGSNIYATIVFPTDQI